MSGPLSGALVTWGLVRGGRGQREAGFEREYGWVIVLTGLTALLGGGDGFGSGEGDGG